MGQLVGCAVVFCFTLFVVNYLKKFLAEKSKSRTGLFGFTKLDLYCHWLALKFLFGSNYDIFNTVMTIMCSWDDSPRDIRILNKHIVYVCRPDDLQIVLNNSRLLEKSNLYKVIKSSLGNGLLTAPVEIWKQHRRFVKPSSYSMKGVEQYVHYFNRETISLIHELEKMNKNSKKYRDLWEPISKATFYMILDVLGGDELPTDVEEIEKSRECFEKLSYLYGLRIYRVWLHPRFIFKWYSTFKGYDEYFEFKDKLLEKKLNERKEIVRKKVNSSASLDEPELISHHLVEQFILRNANGEISDSDLNNHAVTMVVGGSETTATLSCFTILMLAAYPHIQEKVYQEISSLVGADDEPVEMASVYKMNYLEMCLKESLRMFPPVPFSMRYATADVKLSNNMIIRAGSDVIVAHSVVHRNPKYFPNPNKWDPENFSPQKESERPRYAYIPFSAGPRGCIGTNYAMIAAKIIVSKIIKKYRATTDIDPDKMKLRTDVLIRIIGGYNVQFDERKS